MSRNNKEKQFIEKPIFEGGLKALRLFIQKNLKYPEEALNAKIEGTVFIKYTIDYEGKVIKCRVIKGLNYGCDEEAIRLVKLLKFKTAKTRKIKIRYFKSIQIHFKLPKQNTSSISLNYLQINNKNQKGLDNNKTSYHYTIEL